MLERERGEGEGEREGRGRGSGRGREGVQLGVCAGEVSVSSDSLDVYHLYNESFLCLFGFSNTI